MKAITRQRKPIATQRRTGPNPERLRKLNQTMSGTSSKQQAATTVRAASTLTETCPRRPESGQRLENQAADAEIRARPGQVAERRDQMPVKTTTSKENEPACRGAGITSHPQAASKRQSMPKTADADEQQRRQLGRSRRQGPRDLRALIQSKRPPRPSAMARINRRQPVLLQVSIGSSASFA